MKKITLLITMMLFVVTGSFAQASLYTFAQSAGTFVPITGGTLVTSATDYTPVIDDFRSTLLTFPTPFEFGGVSYTNFSVTSNGQLGLGTTLASAGNYRVLSSNTGGNVFFAPFSVDLTAGASGLAEIRFEQVGNEIVVQWLNFRRYDTSESFSFQVRLNTVTKEIKFVYDGTPPFSAETSDYPQIGIKTSNNAGNAIALTVAAGGSWNTPTVVNTTVTNGSVATLTDATGFTSGLTYTFTPPTGCPPILSGGAASPEALSACLGNAPAAISVSGNAYIYSGIAYQWQQSAITTPATWVNAVGGAGANSLSYVPPVFNGTAIQYRLKMTCGNTEVFSTPTVVSTQLAPTTAASALTSSNIFNYGFSTSWTNGNGNRRVVIISPNSITDPAESGPAFEVNNVYAGSGQQIVYDGTGSSVTITGLTCGTAYNVKVYEYFRCGSTSPYNNLYAPAGTTNAITVSTASIVTAPLPVANNFTGFTGTNLGTAVPGWYESAVSTPNGSTPVLAAPVTLNSAWTGSVAFANTVSAKINLFASNKNEWIISPKINITAASGIKFKAAITAANGSGAHATKMDGTDDKVYVMISTDGCGRTWTPLHIFSAANTTTLTNVLQDFTVAIPETYAGQTVQIAFVATDGTVDNDNNYDFHIANVFIDVTPQCDTPSVTAATNVTKNSATINWTEPATGTPTGYEYIVSTTDTLPTGVGTPVTGTITSASITALANATTYYVFVRTVCNTDFSDWSVVGTFETFCDYQDLAGTTPGERCGAGTVDLSANSPGALYWFTAQTGGDFLGTGTTLTTPVIQETTNFYVSSTSPVTGKNFAVGEGLATSNTNGNPFYSNWSNMHTQHLISARELIAAGITAGPINSIALDVTSAGTLPMIDLSIKIGASTATSMTEFTDNTGFANAYASASYMPTVGVNTFTFSTPFTWDGTSNIVVEFCHGNPSSESTMSRTIKMDPTSFVSTVKAHVADNTAASVVCGNTSTSLASLSSRPKFIFNATGVCLSPRVAVAAVVNTPPAFTLSADPVTICVGESTAPVTVTTGAADYTDFVWTPNTGVSGSADAGWIFNPSVTTTYTVQASSATCNAVPVSVVVNVSDLPTAITLADASYCSGSVSASVGLTPFGGTNTTVLLTENFNAATNNWTTVNNSIGGTPANAAWTLQPNGHVYSGNVFRSNDNSQFYISNSDKQDGGDTETILTSPAFSTVNYQAVTVSFYHVFYDPSSESVGSVEFSSNGTDWVESNAFTGSTGSFTSFALGTAIVPANLMNEPVVYVRFKYVAPYTYQWAIDNVTISGQKSYGYTWSPATGLYTDAAATTPYVAGTAAAKVYARPTVETEYTITATNPAGCISTATATVSPVNTAAPTVQAPVQTVCDAATVANLVATGIGIKWYTEATGGFSLSPSTLLTNGAVYYGTQTVEGCESLERVALTANIVVASAPVVTAPTQAICTLGTVADLEAAGTGIKWYVAATGGTALDEDIVLVDGTTYYASQTLDTCESLTRTALTVSIIINDAPTVDAPSQTFCNEGTIAELVINGTQVQWYTTETGGTALAEDTALVNGTTYYASQTINGCESVARTSKSVVVNTVTAPTGDEEQEFCTSATLSQLITNGTGVKWYNDATGTIILAPDTALANNTTYYASQTIDDCESVSRLAVNVFIYNVVADAPENVTTCNEYILPELENGGYFTQPNGEGAEIAAGTVVNETTTFYVYASDGNDIICDDENSFKVTITSVPAPGGNAIQTINAPVANTATIEDIEIIQILGSTVTWYASQEDAESGTEPLPAGTLLEEGATYYATQTVDECTSVAILGVTVDIVLGRDDFDSKVFTYHPNPVTDILNISYSSEITSVTVYNLLGQQVINQKANANEIKIDMSGLADAAYIVNVVAGNTAKTIKVIKKQ